MKPWRVNQEVFKRTGQQLSDVIETHPHIVSPLREEDVVNYFTTEQTTLIFPAKSYAVAIIYALLINVVFGDDVFETLSDPNLLAGNDKYFTSYAADPVTYDRVFSALPWLSAETIQNLPYSQVKATVEYFRAEVLLSGV